MYLPLHLYNIDEHISNTNDSVYMGNVVLISIWLVFQAVMIIRQGTFLGSHSFPYQSLLLSTTVLNDTYNLERILYYKTFSSGQLLLLCNHKVCHVIITMLLLSV